MNKIYFFNSYYGLFLWLPELFKRVELLGGSPCIHDRTSLNRTLYVPPGSQDVCQYINTDDGIYKETFLTASSAIPGNIFTIVFIDKLGRRAIIGMRTFNSLFYKLILQVLYCINVHGQNRTLMETVVPIVD